MEIPEFLETVYLGDRSCIGFVMDNRSGRFKLQVDCISRVRGETWSYYNEENIYDGYLVFTDVDFFEIWPGVGLIPNGLIGSVYVERLADRSEKHRVVIEVEASLPSEPGPRGDFVDIRLNASKMYLEDPRRPDTLIES